MKKTFLIIPLLITLLLMGCSSAATQVSAEQKTPPGDQLTLNAESRELLDHYTATYQLRFDGASVWKYQLITKKSPTERETSLHIEGVTGAQNPGDVRMVTDGKTTWMIGPGTDNECVQFPNNQGMDATLLYPESLPSLAELLSTLKPAGEAAVAGQNSLHFTGTASTAGAWKDVQVYLYQAKPSGALLQFGTRVTGDDPYFGAGNGTINAKYTVDSLDTPTIEPIKGCEVTVPMPDASVNLVRLPGLVSFENPSDMAEISSFYTTRLPQEGWTEKESPSQNEGAIILSYQRNAEDIEIHIEKQADGSSKVKLLFIKAK